MADVPNVVADIAPVQSLVAKVMGDLGDPKIVVQPGASPHGYSMRPSEAAALQDADLVFWIGEDLTPWLEDAIETLAEDANVTSLLEADGTKLLDFREGALFEDHGHKDSEHDEHAEEEGHDDHDNEDHAKDEGHDEHDHEEHSDHEDQGDHDEDDHAAHDDHDHGELDPHAWLSPQNASTWLNVIAAQLSAADPDNAGAYFTNAAAARDEMETLAEDVNAMLEPVRGGSFIVFHDAYQYFEDDFDFPASGAISLGDASDPSPARIAELQQRIDAEGVSCVLAEPQFNPGIVATVLEGTEVSTGVIDPLGVQLQPGAEFYPQLIRKMAQTLVGCLE